MKKLIIMEITSIFCYWGQNIQRIHRTKESILNYGFPSGLFLYPNCIPKFIPFKAIQTFSITILYKCLKFPFKSLASEPQTRPMLSNNRDRAILRKLSSTVSKILMRVNDHWRKLSKRFYSQPELCELKDCGTDGIIWNILWYKMKIIMKEVVD